MTATLPFDALRRHGIDLQRAREGESRAACLHCEWKINDTALAAHMDGDHDEACTVQAGKALCMWLFCIGARSLRATESTFADHPDWRAA